MAPVLGGARRALGLVAIFGTAPLAAPADGAGSPGWAEVAEILVERCVMCHSEQGAGRGLRLDSYEAVLLGGERGPVLVSGDAGASELMRRLLGQSTPRMPFLSRPLPADELELIGRWIDAGLPGPASATVLPVEAAQGQGD